MKFLSIHDGHNSTACLMSDGKIVSLVSEERFTNKKNQGGFPYLSLEYILAANTIKISDIDAFIFPHLVHPIDFAKTYGGHYSYRHFLANLLGYVVPGKILGSKALVKLYISIFSRHRASIIQSYCTKYGIPYKKVYNLEHHSAHRYAALYGSGFLGKRAPIIIFTLDGSGDGLSSTVVLREDHQKDRILSERTSYHSLGELYTFVTKMLGMRPGEHEYKVMGLAPYVRSKESLSVLKKLQSYYYVDDLGNIVNNLGFGPFAYNRLRKELQDERFDNIAAAMQQLFEQLVIKWIRFWLDKTGARSAVFGGGCFMNSKANMLIADLPELSDIFFLPSCGDESTALGGVYYLAELYKEKNPEYLTDLYKGPAHTAEHMEESLFKYRAEVIYRKVDDIDSLVAILLANGAIVGRFAGSSEWGARALGNRSILCRADVISNLHKLNSAIKGRDFWMPFAASVIEEDTHKYFSGVSNTKCSFMVQTYRTNPIAREHLIAGLHQYDFTCRAQIVSKDTAPDYHYLLSKFKELTGMGGVINTSFNLHGAPIVGSPSIAIETLIKSKLDYLALPGYLVRRRKKIV